MLKTISASSSYKKQSKLKDTLIVVSHLFCVQIIALKLEVSAHFPCGR